MRHFVYVTEPLHPLAQARLEEALPIDTGDLALPRAEILRRIAGATIILSKTDPISIDREMMDAAPNLIHVARHGSGYSNVDVAYATSRGISISYLSGLNPVAIAEYTMGLMILAARRLLDAVTQTRLGNPPRSRFLGFELGGRTLGIVGLGQIGREVVKRAAAFGMTIFAYHPRPEGKDFSDLPVTLVPLDDLLARSDIVSLHVPLTADTANMIGAGELALMKESAWLLNLARGGIVDEEALVQALTDKRIAGAVLDVIANEPVRADEPLLAIANCIVLPHIASMTAETQAKTAMAVVENVIAVSRGERPPFLANPLTWPPRTLQGLR